MGKTEYDNFIARDRHAGHPVMKQEFIPSAGAFGNAAEF
jgi:hypothetical protein